MAFSFRQINESGNVEEMVHGCADPCNLSISSERPGTACCNAHTTQAASSLGSRRAMRGVLAYSLWELKGKKGEDSVGRQWEKITTC